MYGTEIIIKITDFEDDIEEIEEIIKWLSYMIEKVKLKKTEEDRGVTNRLSRTPTLLSMDDAVEDEVEISTNDGINHKKIEVDGRIKCICGVEYVKKNKTRHEKTNGHLKFIEQK